VLGRLGRAPEAVERLEPLVGGELSDPATAAVAANNFVVDGHAAGGRLFCVCVWGGGWTATRRVAGRVRGLGVEGLRFEI
jgi:hypothetical protein